MKLTYVSYSAKIDFLSSVKLEDENKYIFVFSDISKNISDNIKIYYNNNINNFPLEISCLLNFLPNIKNDDYYFLDFNDDRIEENIINFLTFNLNDEIFLKPYIFLNNDLKDDVSICFANYRDKVLFSTKNESIISHGFPLVIKGNVLIFILRFIKIFFDLNILNYNLEGIFAILLKLKYG